MKRTQKSGNVSFDGRLTKEIRRHILEKRLQLGLPYQKMATFFDSCWSTIRKWEQGPTRCCSLVMRPKLEAFINGECDEEIINCSKLNTPQYSSKMSASVLSCMERISNIYALLEHHPELRDELLRGLEQVSQRILENLINDGGKKHMGDAVRAPYL